MNGKTLRARPAMQVVAHLALLIAAAACQHKPAEPVAPAATHGFPPEVGRIIQNNCAVAGCHNAASYGVSGGGLLLNTWEHLFDGGNHGAVVVPFSPESSSLLFFVNSYPEFGAVPDPSMKMPLNGTPLSKADYLVLKNWIVGGAPDDSGNVPFASHAETRQKIYLAHQGCDYLSVIDAERHVVMRTVPIGKEATVERAYDLKVGADGTAYVSLWAGDEIARIDTRRDTALGSLRLGLPNSSMLHLSSDGRELLVSSWFSNAVLRLSTVSGQLLSSFGAGQFLAPHGIASNAGFDTFFVTELNGNTVHKIDAGGGHQKLSIDGNPPVSSPGGKDPYDIVMSPDHSRYFVSCAGSNEIRVMDSRTNALLKTIPVGRRPQKLAISRNPQTPYLFVACMEEENAVRVYKGSLRIINYQSYEEVARVGERYNMPHALAVDDQRSLLYVFSRNIDPDGPVPHHHSANCDGRSGYYSVYDFKTLKPLNNKRYEVNVDPFAADVRFK